MKTLILIMSHWFSIYGNIALSCEKLPRVPNGKEMIASVNCLFEEGKKKDAAIESLSSQVKELLTELRHIKKESAAQSNKLATVEASTLRNDPATYLSSLGMILVSTNDRCPTNWTSWTDGEGLFLRGIDPTRRFDNITRGPGDFQEESFKEYEPVLVQTNIGDSRSVPHTNRPKPYNETRPKNVSVWFCILQ